MVVLWLGFLLLSPVSKHNMWSYDDWVYCCCRSSVNTICGRIMIGLSLLSSVSKHNMWLVVLWLGFVAVVCVSIKCGRIMIGLSTEWYCLLFNFVPYAYFRLWILYSMGKWKNFWKYFPTAIQLWYSSILMMNTSPPA